MARKRQNAILLCISPSARCKETAECQPVDLASLLPSLPPPVHRTALRRTYGNTRTPGEFTGTSAVPGTVTVGGGEARRGFTNIEKELPRHISLTLSVQIYKRDKLTAGLCVSLACLFFFIEHADAQICALRFRFCDLLPVILYCVWCQDTNKKTFI